MTPVELAFRAWCDSISLASVACAFSAVGDIGRASTYMHRAELAIIASRLAVIAIGTQRRPLMLTR